MVALSPDTGVVATTLRRRECTGGPQFIASATNVQREGRARPLAALRVRFAQATRRLRRGRILRVRWPHAVFGRAGARPSRAMRGGWGQPPSRK